jgi:hypothetical protein
MVKIPSNYIINISELERQLKNFVIQLRRIGFEPVIRHEKQDREIWIVLDMNDLVDELKRRVVHKNIDFILHGEYLSVVIRY